MLCSIYFCNNSTYHPQFHIFFYTYIFLTSCYTEKTFSELTFVEIVTPWNSHLCCRIASNAHSEISVVLQDGNKDGGCVPGVYYEILLSIWMVMKSTNTVFSEESYWQLSLQAK